MMSFPRALFVALMTLLAMAAMTTMTAAVPTQEDEATKTEREANATREELLKRYVHQTGEGDCSVEHCNACKVESDCKAIHACMWSGDEGSCHAKILKLFGHPIDLEKIQQHQESGL